MIDQTIKHILLSRRMQREDPFEGKWVEEYFPFIVENLGLSDTEIFTCNTLQRRSCYVRIRDKKFILLDNYSLELFLIFNQFIVDGVDLAQLNALYDKIMWESYFVNGNDTFAAIYCLLALNALKACHPITIKQISKNTEPRLIYVQQVFLVAHELMHSWFDSSPEDYLKQKEIIEEMMQTLFADKYPQLVLSYDDDYKEELSCDHIATYLAMDIGINQYRNSPEMTSVSIMLALCHQFILFCIDQWAKDEWGESISRDFNIRLTIAKAYIRNYLKRYIPDSLSVVNEELESVYQAWLNNHFVALIDYLVTQKKRKGWYEKMSFDSDVMQSFKEKMIKSISSHSY